MNATKKHIASVILFEDPTIQTKNCGRLLCNVKKKEGGKYHFEERQYFEEAWGGLMSITVALEIPREVLQTELTMLPIG